MMHRACVSGSIGRRDRISAKRRGATGWPCSQGLLATMALIATLGALSGCGSGQTDSGQANSVPVSLSISMPQKSAPMASASTIGSRLWATLQSWLPTLAEAWAATTTDLSTLTVQVTGPGIPSPITETKVLSAPASGQVITFDLNIPVGLNRVFTVSGIDATKRKIFEGQSSPLTLTAGQAASVDITLTGAGVSEAGVLTDARGSHTATLLPSGQVLVVGGDPCADGCRLASAELFDPATNQWSPRASLTDARESHTATLLPSGQILVVGSRNGATLASAELFDPKTNQWTPRASLTDARESLTATRLPSGQILVVGGMNATGATLASAELFDPATNQWTPRASLTDARVYHTATLLPSGQVLVVGGDGPIGEGSAPLASVELFNPAANTWTSRASLTDARESHTATLLPSGQILVVGGMNATGAPLASAELFDPATNQWTSRASLTDARGFHTATRLLSGQVLVVGGGERFTGTLASAELFEPAANKWTKLATGLTDARGSHTATLLQNGQVLVVGGFGASVVLDSAELLDLSLL